MPAHRKRKKRIVTDTSRMKHVVKKRNKLIAMLISKLRDPMSFVALRDGIDKMDYNFRLIPLLMYADRTPFFKSGQAVTALNEPDAKKIINECLRLNLLGKVQVGNSELNYHITGHGKMYLNSLLKDGKAMVLGIICRESLKVIKRKSIFK